MNDTVAGDRSICQAVGSDVRLRDDATVTAPERSAVDADAPSKTTTSRRSRSVEIRETEIHVINCLQQEVGTRRLPSLLRNKLHRDDILNESAE